VCREGDGLCSEVQSKKVKSLLLCACVSFVPHLRGTNIGGMNGVLMFRLSTTLEQRIMR
jgi:hypothetical protein